jgi:hypothetical protein
MKNGLLGGEGSLIWEENKKVGLLSCQVRSRLSIAQKSKQRH